MPATTFSAAIYGIEARLVTVEADSHRGIHSRVTVVGLPDAAIQEARERIRSAIKNNGYVFPYGRVTFNLSPADWKKEGSGFDLPAALALLISTEQISDAFRDCLIVGELSLDGRVQPTTGILAIAELARRLGKGLVVPTANAAEAASIRGVAVTPVDSLAQMIGWVTDGRSWPQYERDKTVVRPEQSWTSWPTIRAQAQAKRALVIAAAGHHNVLRLCPQTR